ncbi:MAG: hypothetical protein KatS3mg101_0565 [Patescibacteria group bacterium]|nr:MAG: hypothetical protein KatS3mg101_0565 [Patescibacteria group bacterium]
MKRGFSAIFLIVMLFFLATPVVFYLFSLREKSEIRGVSSSKAAKGFSIEISSSGGTWDLYEYGCADVDECGEGLYSGKRVSVTSGGNEKHHMVSFTVKSSSDEIKYVKFFVKPGWGSSQRTFILEPASVEGLGAVRFDEENAAIFALLVPVSYFSSSHFVAGSFSD